MNKNWEINLDLREATHSSGFKIKRVSGMEWVVVAGEADPLLLSEGDDYYDHEYSKNYLNSVLAQEDFDLEEYVEMTNTYIDDRELDYGYISIEDLNQFLNDEKLFSANIAGLIRSGLYFHKKGGYKNSGSE